MSLKAFHLFFIVVSILMAAGLGGWSYAQYNALGERWLLTLGICSFVVMAGLIVYLPWFYKRYRAFSYLAIAAVFAAGSLTSTPALACAVCFGDPNSLMVKSAASGIWLLIGIISAVLLTFIGLFGFWWSRARRLSRNEISRMAA